MKRYINYILAAFILAAAMSATSCEKDNPTPYTPVDPGNTDEIPGQKQIYLDVEFAPVVLNGERGASTTIQYTVKTNYESTKPFVLTLGQNPFFKLEGNTLTALRTNISRKERTDTVLVSHPDLNLFCKIPVSQKSLPRPEGLLEFKCNRLEDALVELFDTDYNGGISPEEALAVEEIDIRGKGITDLTGIGAFKKAWKLDARDNDIVDATDVKGMRQLYWLDLKGNHNLRTFDITGCTIYFEHLDFEVTENLKYYLLNNQVQKEELTVFREGYDGQSHRFHKHIRDDRQTTDWSGHMQVKLIKEHTTGEGWPLVVTGMGFIDQDIEDGSMQRFLKDAAELMIKHAPEYYEQFDFYICTYVCANRNDRAVWGTYGQEQRENQEYWVRLQHTLFAQLREKILPGKDDIPLIYCSYHIISDFSFNGWTNGYMPDDYKDDIWYNLPREIKKLGYLSSKNLIRCSSSSEEEHFSFGNVAHLENRCKNTVAFLESGIKEYLLPYL